MADQQWEVVRSRRKAKPNTSASTTAAVTREAHSGAFHALREQEDSNTKTQEQREKERRKKSAAKERKKQAQRDLDAVPNTQTAAPSTTGTAAGTSRDTPSRVTQQPHTASPPATSTFASLMAWLRNVLWFSLMVWLGLKREKNKKKKSPSQQKAPQAVAPPQQSQPSQQKASQSATPPEQTQPSQQQQPSTTKAVAKEQPAKVAAPPAPAAAPPTAAPSVSKTAKQGGTEAKGTQDSTATTQSRKQGPVRDGYYAVSEVPDAHVDVVSAVATAGQVALTTGYDATVKLWCWDSQTDAPRLVKTLKTSHTGRIEAVSADAASKLAVTSGRDSCLKVWQLGTTPDTAASTQLLHSHYVYESIRCMAVDWSSPGGAVAACGAKSGNISLFDLQTGRKLSVLKRHDKECCCVLWMPHPSSTSSDPSSSKKESSSSATTPANDDEHSQGDSYRSSSPGLLVSGSMDGGLMVWDVRDVRQKKAGVLAGRLQGVRQRVCSLMALKSHFLIVGDCSSTLKIYDLRKLAGPSAPPLAPVSLLPVVTSAHGDLCPVAALTADPDTRVLLSSGVAWWKEEDWESLEEAEEDAPTPTAVLNVHAAAAGDSTTHKYLHTVRLGMGVATCCSALHQGRVLIGSANGSLFSVVCLQKSSVPGADRGLVIGCEELEESSSEEEEDSENED